MHMWCGNVSSRPLHKHYFSEYIHSVVAIISLCCVTRRRRHTTARDTSSWGQDNARWIDMYLVLIKYRCTRRYMARSSHTKPASWQANIDVLSDDEEKQLNLYSKRSRNRRINFYSNKIVYLTYIFVAEQAFDLEYRTLQVLKSVLWPNHQTPRVHLSKHSTYRPANHFATNKIQQYIWSYNNNISSGWHRTIYTSIYLLITASLISRAWMASWWFVWLEWVRCDLAKTQTHISFPTHLTRFINVRRACKRRPIRLSNITSQTPHAR